MYTGRAKSNLLRSLANSIVFSFYLEVVKLVTKILGGKHSSFVQQVGCIVVYVDTDL